MFHYREDRHGKTNRPRTYSKPQSASRLGTKIESQGEATTANAGPADQEKSHDGASPG
jgi:hypothetical protein